jgi:hypothetical protein
MPSQPPGCRSRRCRRRKRTPCIALPMLSPAAISTNSCTTMHPCRAGLVQIPWMKWIACPSAWGEVRQRVQLFLAGAPVVVGRPVTRQLLHRLELHALRRIADGLSFWSLGRHDASTEVVQLLFGDIHAEGDGSRGRRRALLRQWSWSAGDLPSPLLRVRALITAPS